MTGPFKIRGFFLFLLIKLTVTLAIAGLVALRPAHALEAGAERAWQDALPGIEQAQRGQAAAVEPAIERMRAQLQATPNHPLLTAQLGSLQSMQGRDAWLPWNKMKLTENGLSTLDKALGLLTPAHAQEKVQGVPVNLHTRLIAAATFIALPDLFHRRVDGKRTLLAVLADPALTSAPPAFRQAVLFQARQLAEKEKRDAAFIAALERLQQAGPEREAVLTTLRSEWK